MNAEQLAEFRAALPKSWQGHWVLPAHQPASLPPGWLLALQAPCAEALPVLWGDALASLPQTAALLADALQGLAVWQMADGAYCLVYLFRRQGKPAALIGHPPLSGDATGRLARVPAEWQRLYAVHDGWYAPKDRSRGHLPLGAWSLLAGDDWRLEPDVQARLPYSPADTWLVYQHGAGGYLGFVFDGAQPRAIELWSRSLVEPVWLESLLARYDDWTSAMLEEMDTREADEC